MFPKNQYKTEVTVFTPYRNEEENTIRYFRRVLVRTFWQMESITVTQTGGTATPKQVNLNIPLMHNTGYVTDEEWLKIPPQDAGKFWTIRIGGEMEGSIILRGNIEYPAMDEWLSRNDLASVLEDFYQKHMSVMRKPSNIDNILYSIPSLQRVTVLC